MQVTNKRAPIPLPVESRILLVRSQKIILDSALAELYDVPVKQFNQQIKRNPDRFPPDFMFQLTAKECESLRSQIVTSNSGRGGRRYRPYAFTEHGATMAATVLNSKRAVRMSVFVVRAFVHLRETLASNRDLAAKVEEIEARLETHDEVIRDLLRNLKELATDQKAPRKKLGFQLPDRGVATKRGDTRIFGLTALRRFSTG
jgi:phage regulator Rha-like protein